MFKIVVQGPSNQVGKTQLEYAVRSQPRETGCRITVIMVVRYFESRFRLPLMLMGIDGAHYFSKCDWAAVNGLNAHHNELKFLATKLRN
ncbi:MAG: hypothetical protein CBE00_01145 [Planctomycetaceae bacterium TMED240]|nr:MAG: hypothetical protein CBE00_01145 [Planctomycetaceae bacterium TMED240]